MSWNGEIHDQIFGHLDVRVWHVDVKFMSHVFDMWISNLCRMFATEWCKVCTRIAYVLKDLG